ncbi:MAG: DUF4872 domain-containing protein [Anaerolineae bacterium]|nr:DUF4872 domain-containing protein [Anaerolineae bacterium]
MVKMDLPHKDCDRPEVEEVPLSDLELAWNVSMPGLSKKHTLFAFTFGDDLPEPFVMARSGLCCLASAMVETPTRMAGVKGMRTLARELPGWPAELEPQVLEAVLHNLVEYTGMPPMLPNRLTGLEAPEDHSAGRLGFAALLQRLSSEFDVPVWGIAAPYFEQSGRQIEVLTDLVVDHLLGRSSLIPAAALLLQIAGLEEAGYRAIQKSC